jgi:hypothetical protein
MDAMVMRTGQSTQPSFEKFRSWASREGRPGFGMADVKVSMALLGDHVGSPRRALAAGMSSAVPLTSDLLAVLASSSTHTTSLAATTSGITPGTQMWAELSCSGKGTTPSAAKPLAVHSEMSAISDLAIQLCVRTCKKRRRKENDVDGPNTAVLSSKKRRIQQHVTTSGLSRPSSLPPPYLCKPWGEGRSVRVSAINAARKAQQSRQSQLRTTMPTHSLESYARLDAANAARQTVSAMPTSPQPQHHPSTSPDSVLRRAAILNRFRLRVGREAASRGDQAVAQVAANAALLNQAHHGLGSAWHLDTERKQDLSHSAAKDLAQAAFAQMIRGSLKRPDIASPTMPPQEPATAVSPQLPARLQPHPCLPHPLSRAAIGRSNNSPPPSPKSLRPVDSSISGLRLPPSPRLRPLTRGSPRRPSLYRPLDDEELADADDGEVAFPTSEHESRYEGTDDLDDVYADFSVIFGGSGLREGDGAGELDDEDDGPVGGMAFGDDGGGEGFEDYMDELDGIPWGSR